MTYAYSKYAVSDDLGKPLSREQTGTVLLDQRILNLFFVNNRMEIQPPKPLPSMFVPGSRTSNRKSSYGRDVAENLKNIGYKIIAQRDLVFSEAPNYLLMRKSVVNYNIALSFTSLMTIGDDFYKEKDFFKCVIKFEAPDDTETDENLQLRTNPLKTLPHPYKDSIVRDFQEIMTILATHRGLADEKNMPFFDNVVKTFKLCQRVSYVGIRDVVDISFLDPDEWYWLFQIGCDSVTVYAGLQAFGDPAGDWDVINGTPVPPLLDFKR
jgi:hypothetical protein